MVTFFWVLNDYGIPMGSLMFMNPLNGYLPAAEDVYDPDQPNFGNSQFANGNNYGSLAWGYHDNAGVDIRLVFNTYTRTSWTKCRWDPNDESIPQFWRISPLEGAG
jgi:hypothetical protein